MSVFEIRGGNDRRSMIKRYERKSKQDAIRELVDLIHCNWSQLEQLEAQLASQLATAPKGYALVPLEPTPEMVRAAEEAHMPFGDMDIALRMAVLAAAPSPADHVEDALTMVEPATAGWMPDIDATVSRFLSWTLPKEVCADHCASMPGYPHRSGTNLMNAEQAKAMLLHVLAAPTQLPAQPDAAGLVAALKNYLSAVDDNNTDERGVRWARHELRAALAAYASQSGEVKP